MRYARCVVCVPGLVSTMPAAVSASGEGPGEPHTPSLQLGLSCGTYREGVLGLVPDSSVVPGHPLCKVSVGTAGHLVIHL